MSAEPPRQVPARAVGQNAGGAWLRPFRRWDGYREAVAAALRQLHGRDDDAAADEREEELAGR